MIKASTRDIPAGTMVGIDSGDKSILIANVGGQFYAINNICTHMGCSLSNGTLRGNQVQCPCHGSTFDVTNGSLVHGPARLPEPSYKVTVEGENINVDVP
jgi:nitrite reductase/ring-hydroxylating ferredoxin subunit